MGSQSSSSAHDTAPKTMCVARSAHLPCEPMLESTLVRLEVMRATQALSSLSEDPTELLWWHTSPEPLLLDSLVLCFCLLSPFLSLSLSLCMCLSVGVPWPKVWRFSTLSLPREWQHPQEKHKPNKKRGCEHFCFGGPPSVDSSVWVGRAGSWWCVCTASSKGSAHASKRGAVLHAHTSPPTAPYPGQMVFRRFLQGLVAVCQCAICGFGWPRFSLRVWAVKLRMTIASGLLMVISTRSGAQHQRWGGCHFTAKALRKRSTTPCSHLPETLDSWRRECRNIPKCQLLWAARLPKLNIRREPSCTACSLKPHHRTTEL